MQYELDLMVLAHVVILPVTFHDLVLPFQVHCKHLEAETISLISCSTSFSASQKLVIVTNEKPLEEQLERWSGGWGGPASSTSCDMAHAATSPDSPLLV